MPGCNLFFSMFSSFSFKILFTSLCILFSINSHSESDNSQESIDTIIKAIKVRDRMIERLIKKMHLLEGEMKKLQHQQTVKDIITPHLKAQPPSLNETQSNIQNNAQNKAIQTARQEVQQDRNSLFLQAFETKLQTQGNLLLPPSTQALDLSISMAHTTNDAIVINGFTIVPVLVVGDIATERKKREHYLTTFTWRLGLPQKTQLDILVPWAYQKKSIITAETEEENYYANGFRDVEIGLNHQLLDENPIFNNVIIGFRWKTRSSTDPYKIKDSQHQITGTGFDTLSFFATSITVNDPLAFFSSLAVSENLPAKKTIGTIQPGLNIGYSFGANFAINLDSTFFFGLTQSWTAHTQLNNKNLPNTEQHHATLQLGIQHQLLSKHTFNLRLGIGLTADTPNFTIRISRNLFIK